MLPAPGIYSAWPLPLCPHAERRALSRAVCLVTLSATALWCRLGTWGLVPRGLLGAPGEGQPGSPRVAALCPGGCLL